MDDEDLNIVFASFCNQTKILKYFDEFRVFLESTENVILLNKIKTFSRIMRVLEKSDLFDVLEPESKGICNDEKSKSFSEDFNDILLHILEIFCVKHSKIILQVQDGLQNYTERAITLDIIAYLIKKYINEIKNHSYIESLIENICCFLTNVRQRLANFTVISESELAPLFFTVLKFVAKFFQCIPNDKGEYFSENAIIILIARLPFTDPTTVKLFVNYILPAVIKVSKESFKSQIFMCIWQDICLQFNINEGHPEQEAFDAYSCIYTLLCCLSECMYNTQGLNVLVHDKLIFWQIIMSGLTSSFPFTRKKSLNVFKMFLSWINHSKTSNHETVVVQSTFSKFRKDMKIWNDVVTLFESLEEKQIHVIKPVLPKFTRILQLTTKDNTALPERSWDFPPSCVLLALLSRLLKHETKFVVKWALSTVLTLDFKVYNFHKNDDWLWLLKYILEAFNDQTLYSRNNEQDNYSLFLSSEKISAFFKNYISSLESLEEKVSFMRNLLLTIASQSWCHVALMHVVFALTDLESIPSWNRYALTFIRKIVLDCQRNQESVFRTALEYFLLECCSLFLDWNVLKCGDIAELLIIFKSTAVLRHSRPWNRFAEEFKANIFIDSSSSFAKEVISGAAEFCIQSIKKIQENVTSEPSGVDIEELEIEKVARIVLMLADLGVICPANTMTDGLNWSLLLKPVLNTLQLASKRPYMNNKNFLSYIKLISLLIKESYGCKESYKDVHTSSILQCLQNCSEMVEFMYQKLFLDIESCSYISQNNIIFEAFYFLTAESKLKNLFTNMMPVLTKNVEDLLEDSKQRKYLLFPLWKMLNNIVFNEESDHLENKSKLHQFHRLNYKVIKKATNENILSECLSKQSCLDNIEREQWLQFSYNAVCYFWDVSSFAIQHLESSEFSDVALPLAEEARKIFENGPKIAVPYALKCMKFLIPKLGLLDLSVMSDLLETSWVACLELRGNETFRPALSFFIEVIFQTEMLQDIFFNTLYKYIDRFKELSENILGVFYNVIKQFCNSLTITSLIHSNFDCIPVFVHALTFGPIHQKAHKIMEETLTYLMERDIDFSNSLTVFENSKPSTYVRIIVINYLLKNLSKGYEEFTFEIANQLLKVDIDDDGKQSSHFSNSFSHRIRNRAWQGIVLLQQFITNQDLNEQLLLKTLDTLGTENQQPSIRYLQEWVIFNIVRTHTNLLNKYISLFEQSLEKRPSYIISVISITNLLILHNVLVKESDILRCFKLVTVLCMAQNFTVRLHAQMVLTNLFSLCQQEKLGGAILQYEFVLQLIEMQKSLVGQGNFFKNVIKLSNDFYFSIFKPKTHFTLETIFYELPRLSNLSPDEWIKPSLFSNDSLNVPLYNFNDDLKNSIPTSWTYKSGTEALATEESSLDYNFQKKIIPIKDMLNDFEGLSLVDNTGKNQCKDGLVVVASLIDRIPNLGGLCRTCEVFAVSEFVIGNLKYVEDRQFQTLSVSADKWVPIKEVKAHQLKDYLISMKEKGYVLIGAEQTEDSCTLNKYTFPKKSVLLLGHEKEGLSVDLIQLLDVCVEIPQQGVVRSLNVHVSGAILIWEYARQHIKSS